MSINNSWLAAFCRASLRIGDTGLNRTQVEYVDEDITSPSSLHPFQLSILILILL